MTAFGVWTTRSQPMQCYQDSVGIHYHDYCQQALSPRAVRMNLHSMSPFAPIKDTGDKGFAALLRGSVVSSRHEAQGVLMKNTRGYL